jgi:hypothetical protein
MNQLEKMYLLLSFANCESTIDYLIQRAHESLIMPEFIEFQVAADYKKDCMLIPFNPFD